MSSSSKKDDVVDIEGSSDTRVEDNLSLLDALDQMGLVRHPSVGRVVAVGLTSVSLVGVLYVYSRMKLIPDGSMGLVLENGQPRFMRSGRHVVANPLHSFQAIASINDERIELGPVTIVTIKKGQLGLSWKNGETIILQPGRHILVAPHTFQGAKDITDNYIELGPIKRMIVNEGQVGISYDAGKLEVLPPGLHIRNSPTYKFKEFISIQEQVKRLEPLTVNTNDGIAIKVNAIIIYRVEDPIKAFKDVNNAVGALFDKAEATLTSIFLHHSIDEIAPTLPSLHKGGGNAKGDSDDGDDDEDIPTSGDAKTAKKQGKKGKGKQVTFAKTALLFSDLVREAFLTELKEYVTTWGIVLIDMSIEKLEFHDPALRVLLTERASNKLQTASNRANIAAQAQTGIQKAQGLAQEARIKADAELYTAEQLAKGARLQADTELAKQLAILRAMKDIVAAAGDKTTFIPWGMAVDLREGALSDEKGFNLGRPSRG